MSINDLPSIGTATGTRVDSAAKHIMSLLLELAGHAVAPALQHRAQGRGDVDVISMTPDVAVVIPLKQVFGPCG